MLQASCSNCSSWVAGPAPGPDSLTLLNANGSCTKSLAPDQGQVLCTSYQPTRVFVQAIMSEMLSEGSLVVEIPVGGKLGREARLKQRTGSA
ncbi:MAG TPA: hypothetical protein VNZ52_14285 [Candidatus Thermoplasmatota archaeon]|nr:hypothetical protein [Candidatus Thermoplasmatota archaeon]